MIDSGAAEFMVHLECATTIFRKIIKSARGEFFAEINLSRVKNVLEIVAAVVIVKDVENFSCKDWSADFYGLKFNLAKGNILAYKTLASLKIPDNPDNFAGEESIFSVCRKVEVENYFNVDFTDEKIKITLSDAEYNFFVNANENLELQPLVNSLVILPALIYVLEQVRIDNEFENYQNLDWFISLKNNYPNLVEELDDTFKLAQKLINLPLARAFDSLKKVYGEGEE